MIPRDDKIHLVQLEEGKKIGDKRNFAASLANGEILIHWDDDDWSAPGRIQDQVDRLLNSGMAVTGYSSLLFTNGTEWWRYEGGNHYALGTSLCYQKDWWKNHPFPSKQIGEDGEFTRAARGERKLITAPGGDFMYATIHPGNTSKRVLNLIQWKPVEGISL